MKKIESYLPLFPGFYGTHFESDQAEEMALEENQDANYDDFEFDYQDYMNKVSMSAIGSVENYLKHDGFSIGIEFDKVYSPRYYNFSNDQIYCTYSVSDVDYAKLVEYCEANYKEFKAFLLENYASCSGFISFFDTKPETWFDEYLNEDSDEFEQSFVGILEFYLQNEEYTLDDMHEDCQEDCGYIDYKLLTKKDEEL